VVGRLGDIRRSFNTSTKTMSIGSIMPNTDSDHRSIDTESFAKDIARRLENYSTTDLILGLLGFVRDVRKGYSKYIVSLGPNAEGVDECFYHHMQEVFARLSAFKNGSRMNGYFNDARPEVNGICLNVESHKQYIERMHTSFDAREWCDEINKKIETLKIMLEENGDTQSTRSYRNNLQELINAVLCNYVPIDIESVYWAIDIAHDIAVIDPSLLSEINSWVTQNRSGLFGKDFKNRIKAFEGLYGLAELLDGRVENDKIYRRYFIEGIYDKEGNAVSSVIDTLLDIYEGSGYALSAVSGQRLPTIESITCNGDELANSSQKQSNPISNLAISALKLADCSQSTEFTSVSTENIPPSEIREGESTGTTVGPAGSLGVKDRQQSTLTPEERLKIKMAKHDLKPIPQTDAHCTYNNGTVAKLDWEGRVPAMRRMR